MATDVPSLSVNFSEEAEHAIQKATARYERRLRAQALDAAVRSRGVPAEVTGSDIAKADFDLRARREIRRGFSRLEERRLLESRDRGTQTDIEHWIHRPPYLSALDRVASLYIRLGAFTALAGVGILLFYRAYIQVKTDPVSRVGLLVTAAGLGTVLLGYAVRVIQKGFYKRRPIR
jgi:hypothetical protein